MSEDTITPERVEIMRCTLTVQASGSRELLCNSVLQHQMLGGSTVTLREMPANVHVSITEGTATVAEKTVAPNYVTEEVNGPGCGTCTHATLNVTVPEGSS